MSKFREAESYKEFYVNFSQYVSILAATKDHDHSRNLLVKEWAEYSAVNKKYICDGFSHELEKNIRDQMICLLKENYPILDSFLALFGNNVKEHNFSELKRWINDVIMISSEDDDIIVKKIEEAEKKVDEAEESEKKVNEKAEKESELEQVVTETLVDGAKMIGNLVGMVDNDIKRITTEIVSLGKPRMVKVKVVGPKKLDFLSIIIDFLPTEESGVIETELDDYDIGIYAFDHGCWGDLETVQDDLPGKIRIACNIGSFQGDIYLYPLFSEVWEFEYYTKQDILSKLTSFV